MPDHKADNLTTIEGDNVFITYNPTRLVDLGVPYACVTIYVKNEPNLGTEKFVEAAENLATLLNMTEDGWVVNVERATEVDLDEGGDDEANDEDVTTEDDYFALTDVDELIEYVADNVTQAREDKAEEVFRRLEESVREEIYRREFLDELKNLDNIDNETSRQSAKLDTIERYFDHKRGRIYNRATPAQRREMLKRDGVEV